jgi:hypothetical protein
MGSFTAQPAEEMPSEVGMPVRGPVTGFLYLAAWRCVIGEQDGRGA